MMKRSSLSLLILFLVVCLPISAARAGTGAHELATKLDQLRVAQETEYMHGQMVHFDQQDIDFCRNQIDQLAGQIKDVSDKLDHSFLMFPSTRRKLEAQRNDLSEQQKNYANELKASSDDLDKQLAGEIAEGQKVDALITKTMAGNVR